jgi:hypothetical protein
VPADRGEVKVDAMNEQATEDPGAYIGSEPEREAETIPGGVDPKDERTSGSNSRPGVAGEPEDGDTSDVVEGDVGSASLKEPAAAESAAADLDRLPSNR